MSEEERAYDNTDDEERDADWYVQTILGAELADYTPVRGSIAIRPYGYAIWEAMQSFLDRELKATGHQAAYFPLLIPMSFLQKEAQHVEGFAPELAVVTHGGGQELAEQLVIRPTSETIIYDMYRKWVKSYRDLPILIYQWANVVRWEMRTRPFLRGMEFLWHEGHTAHATFQEADDEARLILSLYVNFIETQLAIPVLPGRKSEREKFAGADITYTMESLMRDGKALQMGTSHNLGQNFGIAFDVHFLDKSGQQQAPWSTSWAVSTRLIGALILTHGDAKGLVLPPRIAPIQVVIVPIWRKEEEREQVEATISAITEELRAANLRFEVDRRENVTPGFKFNHWELRGVPLRVEVGPRDVAQRQAVIARRDTGEKTTTALNNIAGVLHGLLDDVQQNLLERARKFLEENTYEVGHLEALTHGLEHGPGFYSVYWCGDPACEDTFITLKASIRALPLDDSSVELDAGCICCGNQAKHRVIVAKAY